MAKGKKSFLDYFRVSDDDEDYDEETDDLFDEEDDDYDEGFSFRRKKKEAAAEPPEEPAPRPQYSKPAPAPRSTSSYQAASTSSYTPPARASQSGNAAGRRRTTRQAEDPNKLVSFDSQRRRTLNPSSEVYVIKPQEFDDAQTVTDLLKGGKTIVINMEGVEIDPAQRIIDFIGGACYGLGGDLRAISASIFIAAPNNIEVSGDLRDEILNESTLSPQLGKY